MQKKVKITKKITICDFRGCQEEIECYCCSWKCEDCGRVFCEDHLRTIGNGFDGMWDDSVVLCVSCLKKYEKEITPLLNDISEFNKEVMDLDEKINDIAIKRREVWDEVKEICRS